MNIVNIVLNEFTNDSRVLKTSKTLQKLGYKVTVVALHDIGLREYELVDNIPVRRIRLSSRKLPRNKIVQAFKFLEFIARFKLYYGNEMAYHCNDLSGLIVGVVCKMFNWSAYLVYDSHEYAINDQPFQSLSSIKFKYWLERFLIQFPKQVINVSPSIVNEYARLYGIPKPNLVMNCPNYVAHEKNNLFREKYGILENQYIFLYQGRLGIGRGIELLLETFATMQDKRCVLVFMGYGPLENIIHSYTLNNTNIFFHPAVSPKYLLKYTSSADFGISFIEDLCLSYRFCLPNKVFEYLMAGIPLLTSNLVELRRLVHEECVGVVAESNTTIGFRNAIEAALMMDYDKLKQSVHNARMKYCWESQEKAIKSSYNKLNYEK